MDELVQAALEARRRAHAPYSGFSVGAALRTTDGSVYTGCNVENASYPEGWCAETSAIAQMVMAGKSRISEILVAAESERPITPCGGCRQRLAEFGMPDTLVHSANNQGLRGTWRLGDLIPHAFGLDVG